MRLDLDLRASRQRIVAAQDAERRRLERDIHDGAQQELVALAINVRVAQELLRTNPAQAEVLLEQVGVQAIEALETLRELARGIFPSVLADRGLVPALETHLAKTSLAVELRVEPDVGTARFGPDAEAAIYFCCLEALQNCAKHAPDSKVMLELAADDSWLTFTVVDGGPGFVETQTHAGTGLRGMADRLAALGGSFEVQSAPGNGTRVRGRLPVQRPVPVVQDKRPPAIAFAQAVRNAAGPN